MARAGQLDLRLQSTVLEICADSVRLQHRGQELCIPNDAVVICAGGILPTVFLKRLGIQVDTHFGEVRGAA